MESKKCAKIEIACLGESSDHRESMILLSHDKSFDFLTESVYTLGILSKCVKDFFRGDTINLDNGETKIKFFDYCSDQFRTIVQSKSTPFDKVKGGFDLYMKFYNNVDFVPTLLEMWMLTSIFECIDHVLYKTYVCLNVITCRFNPNQYCKDINYRERNRTFTSRCLISDEFLSVRTYQLMDEYNEKNPYYEIVRMNHFKCILFTFIQCDIPNSENENIALACSRCNNLEFISSYIELFSGIRTIPGVTRNLTSSMIEFLLSFVMYMLKFSIRFSNNDMINFIIDVCKGFNLFPNIPSSFLRNIFISIIIKDDVSLLEKLPDTFSNDFLTFFFQIEGLYLCYTYNSTQWKSIWFQHNWRNELTLDDRKKILLHVCKHGKIESLQTIITDGIIYEDFSKEINEKFISSVYLHAVRNESSFLNILSDIIPYQYQCDTKEFLDILYELDNDNIDHILLSVHVQNCLRESSCYLEGNTACDDVSILARIYNIVGDVNMRVLTTNIEYSIGHGLFECFKFLADLASSLTTTQSLLFNWYSLISLCLTQDNPSFLIYLYSLFNVQLNEYFTAEFSEVGIAGFFMFLILDVKFAPLSKLFEILDAAGITISYDVILCRILRCQSLCSDVSFIDLVCSRINLDLLTTEQRNSIDDAILSHIILSFDCFYYLATTGVANIQGRINDYMDNIIRRNKADFLEFLFQNGVTPRTNNNIFFIRALTNVYVKLSTLEQFFKYDNTLLGYSNLAQIRQFELSIYNPPTADPVFFRNVLDFETYRSCMEVIEFLSHHVRGTAILNVNQIQIVIVPNLDINIHVVDGNEVQMDDAASDIDIDDIEWEE